jgi:hypothetical protein
MMRERVTESNTSMLSLFEQASLKRDLVLDHEVTHELAQYLRSRLSFRPTGSDELFAQLSFYP